MEQCVGGLDRQVDGAGDGRGLLVVPGDASLRAGESAGSVPALAACCDGEGGARLAAGDAVDDVADRRPLVEGDVGRAHASAKLA